VVHYAHVTGIVVEHAYGVTLEENVIYFIGEILKQQGSGVSPHGIYVTNKTGTGYTVRNNIISDIGYSALDMRPDFGVAEDNLIARAPAGMDIGAGPEWSFTPDTTVKVSNNVILDGRSPFLPGVAPYGVRIAQGDGTSLTNNIICNSGVTAWRGIREHLYEAGQYCKNLTIKDNIVYNWGGDQVNIDVLDPSTVTNLVLDSNDFQQTMSAPLVAVDTQTLTAKIDSLSNRFYSPSGAAATWFMVGTTGMTLDQFKAAVGDTSSVAVQVQYKNADGASTAGYHASLGKTATHEAFMAEALKQSKDNWRTEYTANAVNTWIRDCFNK